MGARGSIFEPQICNCIKGKEQRDGGHGGSIFEPQIGNCIGGKEQRDGGQGVDFRAPNRQLYTGK